MATLVTKPPILDSTGKEIVEAIKGLKNTDASLSIAGKPADAKITGKRFRLAEDKIRSLQTILSNILGGALSEVIEVTSLDEMVDRNRIYKYVGGQDTTQNLYYGHWYWYGGNEWNDGGVWAQVPSIPEGPDANGTYVLQCTVSNGSKTYTWQAI